MSEYQPKIFPKDIFDVRFSTVADGNMMHGPEFDPVKVNQLRREFLKESDLDLEKAHLLRVTYDTDNFCRYGYASEETQSFAREHSYTTPAFDALVHDKPEEAIIVPFADCAIMVALAVKKAKGVATGERMFMMSHLGRNSLVDKGARLSIEFFAGEAGVDMSDVSVFVGPAAGRENFPIFGLGGVGIQQAVRHQLREAGVRNHKMEISPFDTTTDKNLYSHSEALKGRRESNGRQIMFAALRNRS